MKKALSFILVLALVFLPLMTNAVESIETPVPPPEIEEIIEEYQTVYRLTIYYVYLDGTTAAPTYTEQLDAGALYNVTSPVITGYTASILVVKGVMPARDIEYTVIYIPDPADVPDDPNPIKYFNSDSEITTIEEYNTPLGLGGSIMNVGICVE